MIVICYDPQTSFVEKAIFAINFSQALGYTNNTKRSHDMWAFLLRTLTMFIDGIEYKKAIIIDYPWVDYILDQIKTWEMRSTTSKFRGKIAIIAKGTGCIVGVGDFVDSLPKMNKEQLILNFDKHHVDYEAHPELLKWCCPWVINNVKRIEPIPYDTRAKRGAVIWVNI